MADARGGRSAANNSQRPHALALKALAEVALQYNINLDCLDPDELTLLIINCKLYIPCLPIYSAT